MSHMSINDLLWVSPDILYALKDFKVFELSIRSDHFPIFVEFLSQPVVEHFSTEIVYSFLWKESSVPLFTVNMNSSIVTITLNDSIDDINSKLLSYIYSAVTTAGMSRVISPSTENTNKP